MIININKDSSHSSNFTCDSCPLDALLNVSQAELEAHAPLLLLLLLAEGELQDHAESRHRTSREVVQDFGRMRGMHCIAEQDCDLGICIPLPYLLYR